MASESIKRFIPDHAVTDTSVLRAEIEQHVADYLARGGTITQVTSDDNRNHNWSPNSLQHRQARFESAGRHFNKGPRDQ